VTTTRHLRCACGRVELDVEGTPILSAECCCKSCRTAGARLQSLPGAAPLLGEHGTTRFELYRKDRVRFLAGTDLFAELRLAPGARTRRVVATCCNTPVFLDFEKGHWLSLYGGLWPTGSLPRLEMRTMKSDLSDPGVLPDDVPNARRQSLAFFAKLLGAWVAMGFRTPKLPRVERRLEV
jgi:hypothetical protein